MSIKNPIKNANVAKINCDGTFKVKIGITGVPDISDNPADIILILDKSSSMSRNRKLENMKLGAKNQIDIITKATGGILDNKIGGGSRIGLVVFSTDAKLEVPLTDDVKVLKENITKIVATGNTNHGDAFLAAVNAFDKASSNTQIIIMFTDGAINDGPDPVPITEAAKAQGIEIYCIGVENANLNFEKWASKPTDAYIAYSIDPYDLNSLFVDIGNRIASTGATNSKITETLNKDFKIVDIELPSFGAATKQDDNRLVWDINGIGKDTEENASLTFLVQHIGTTGGVKKFNEKIEYVDDEKNVITFPEPTIEVECNDMDKIVEPCPVPVEFTMNGCQDTITVNVNNAELESLGRMIEINTTIKNVCPNKKVAVAVKLVEIDGVGKEYARGMKFFTIPAHVKEQCSDIALNCVRFVVPENNNSLCGTRTFKAYVYANYMDTDFKCCDTKIVM